MRDRGRGGWLNCGGAVSAPRVLVLDGWEPMALGACRGAGHMGHTVGAAGTDRRRNIVARSRYVSRHDTLPDPWGPAAPYEAALRELVEREGYDALISVHDQTLARLASIDLPVPTTARLDDAWAILQDKLALAEVAERAGVVYPRTEPAGTPEELDSALERLGLPVFVKSSVSALALPDRVEFERGCEAYAHPRGHLRGRRAALGQAAGDHPEGDRSREKLGVVVLRRDGRTELGYVHRVLREYPREGGIGISLESLDPDSGDGAEAIAALERVCDEVGYQGIIQAEMYRSTPTTASSSSTSIRGSGDGLVRRAPGLPVIERSLRVALDLPPLPPRRPDPGMRFHDLSAELRWLMHEPSRWAGLRELVRTTRPRDHFEWVDLTDPMPMAHYVADRIRKRLGREHAPDATWRPGQGGAPTRGARSGSR